MKKLTITGWVLAAACLTLGLNTAIAASTTTAQSSQSAKPAEKQDGMEKKLQKMKTELSLSDEQMEKVRDIMKDAHDDMKEMHEKFEALRDKMKEDIKEVLNDEQKAKYEKMCAEHKAKHDKKMKKMKSND